MIKRVTKNYKYNAKRPVNYIWPEEVSYQNPIVGVKQEYEFVDWWFKLQSGEKSDNTVSNDGFEDLDWSQITSLKIRYDKNSYVCGYEFFNSQNKLIMSIGYTVGPLLKVNFR